MARTLCQDPEGEAQGHGEPAPPQLLGPAPPSRSSVSRVPTGLHHRRRGKAYVDPEMSCPEHIWTFLIPCQTHPSQAHRQPSSRGPHPLKPGMDVLPASSHLPLIWKFCCLEQLKGKLWFLRLIIFPFFPRALAKCQTFLSKFFGIKAGNGLQNCEERTGNEARDGHLCPPCHTHCHTTPPLPPCTAPR